MRANILTGVAIALMSASAYGDTLPDTPGRAAVVRVCGRCHSPERAATMHQSRSGWEDTIVKMVKLGAEGSDEEFDAILNYLSHHFATEAPPSVNINKDRAVDLEAGLLLRRSEATAIVAYRDRNGAFQSVDDLRRVPGIDFHLIELRKARIVF